MNFDTAFILVKDLAQSNEDGKQAEKEKKKQSFCLPMLIK